MSRCNACHQTNFLEVVEPLFTSGLLCLAEVQLMPSFPCIHNILCYTALKSSLEEVNNHNFHELSFEFPIYLPDIAWIFTDIAFHETQIIFMCFPEICGIPRNL